MKMTRKVDITLKAILWESTKISLRFVFHIVAKVCLSASGISSEISAYITGLCVTYTSHWPRGRTCVEKGADVSPTQGS